MTARSYRFITANTNNLRQIGPAPSCKLVGASLINTSNTVFYVKLWWFRGADAAAAGPTVGTTAPDLVIAVPPLDAAGGAGYATPSWPGGVCNAGAPLWVACVTGAADSDNTAVAAGQGNINLLLE